MKDLARMSVGQVLNEHDIDTEKEVLLCDTDKDISMRHIYNINESHPIKFGTAVRRLYRVLFYVIGGKWLLLELGSI